MKKIFTNLTFWVLTAILLGVLFGAYYPKEAQELRISFPDWKNGGFFWDWKTLGDAFITIVKLFINPIIFLTITIGIAAMGDLKKVGKTGGKALLYFEVVTTLALVVGVVVAAIIQPGHGIDTSKAAGADVSKYQKSAEAFSWMKFFWDNMTLQVLTVSLILGTVLSRFENRKTILDPLSKISKYVFKGVSTEKGKKVAVIAFTMTGQMTGSGTYSILVSDGTLFSSNVSLNLASAGVSVKSKVTRV